MARKKPKPRSKIKLKITQRHADTPKKIPFMVALANKMLGEIGFVDLMDESVEWDKKQCHVSPGNHLKAIILSTFMGGLRSPLCNIGEKYETMDTEYLFGENVEPEHLNDHAIGRSLDKLAKAGPEKLLGSLALSAYGRYSIAFNRLHSDTTTVSFYGDYDTDTAEENAENQKAETGAAGAETVENNGGPLKILKGYNKDHRPECKQVVVGKIVSEHGIPLYSEVMDGNTSDVDWNEKAVKATKEMFGDLIGGATYVADCKLITGKMVKLLTNTEKPIKFISKCPANFNARLAAKCINEAYEDNNWSDIGVIGTGKNASDYKGCEYIKTVYGRDLRLLVVKSSEREGKYVKKVENELLCLEKDIKSVNAKVFVCKSESD